MVEFLANATTARGHWAASSAELYTTAKQGVPLGRLRRGWELRGRLGESCQDGSNDGIFGQRYDSAGATLGTEFRVNLFTTNGQRSPDIASDSSGNFCRRLGECRPDRSSYGIFGQRYDGAGVAQGG
jgi:hypothetical protein